MSCKCEMEKTTVHEAMGAHGCCDMHLRLLELADEAWIEVLKEKIKAEILATSGAHMDKVAKLVASSNKAKWSAMVNGKVQCEDYKTALKELMSTGCKS